MNYREINGKRLLAPGCIYRKTMETTYTHGDRPVAEGGVGPCCFLYCVARRGHGIVNYRLVFWENISMVDKNIRVFERINLNTADWREAYKKGAEIALNWRPAGE